MIYNQHTAQAAYSMIKHPRYSIPISPLPPPHTNCFVVAHVHRPNDRNRKSAMVTEQARAARP